MIAILLIFIVVLLLIYQLNKQKYTPEGIPIIGNIPWLGCGLSLKLKGGKFLRECRAKYGDIFQIQAGGKALTFVFTESFYSPFYKSGEQEMGFYEGIKDDNSQFHFDTILGVKNESPEEKREVSAIKPIRNFLQEAAGSFAEVSLNPHFDFFLDYAKQRQNVSPLSSQFSLELQDMCVYLTMGLGATTLAGFQVASDPQFLSEVKTLCTSTLQVLTSPRILAKNAVKRCAHARNMMRQVIDKAIRDSCISGLGVYLQQTKYESTGRQYGVEETSYSTFAMIFATMSNTSSAMTNSLVDILVYPEVKRKVMEELHEVVVKHPRNIGVKDGNYFIDQEMVEKMEYLTCCITETLRLYAPAAHIRKLQIDMHGENGEVLIRKGSFVCVSPWIRHREEKTFENAELYDPNRFAKGVKQKRFSFITFGHGRHHCLGKHLADSIIRVTIAKLLLRYDIKVINDQTSSRNADPKISWFGFGVLKPAVPVLCQFSSKF